MLVSGTLVCVFSCLLFDALGSDIELHSNALLTTASTHLHARANRDQDNVHVVLDSTGHMIPVPARQAPEGETPEEVTRMMRRSITPSGVVEKPERADALLEGLGQTPAPAPPKAYANEAVAEVADAPAPMGQEPPYHTKTVPTPPAGEFEKVNADIPVTNGTVEEGDEHFTLIGGTMLVLTRNAEKFMSDAMIPYSLKFIIASKLAVNTTRLSLALDPVGFPIYDNEDFTMRGLVKARYCALYPSNASLAPASMLTLLRARTPEMYTGAVQNVLAYLGTDFKPEITFHGAMLGCETELMHGDIINGAAISLLQSKNNVAAVEKAYATVVEKAAAALIEEAELAAVEKPDLSVREE